MINEDVECRLRISGSFGLRNGIKQHCMMLDRRMNVTMMEVNAEESTFDCKNCPDPAKRDTMLEKYKDVQTCKMCNVNMGIKIIEEPIEIFGGMEAFEKGDNLCISCYENVEQELMDRDRAEKQKELKELELKYEKGEISYSELLVFKEKMG